MRRHRRGVGVMVRGAALALLALAACKPAPPPGPTAVGAATAVVPSATLATPPQAAHAAAVDAQVFANDRIVTGPEGALRVRFVDATQFSVGANSAVTVDSFVFDPARGKGSMAVSFTNGAFRFVSGAAAHGEGDPIRTPVATIGVRGTTVTGVIGPEAARLWELIDNRYRQKGDSTTATLILLEEGAIDVNGSGKRIALDRAGQALFFPRKGADPIGPVLLWRYMIDRIVRIASPPALDGPPSPPSPTPAPPPAATPSAKPSPTPKASPTVTPTPTLSPTPSPAPSATRRPPRPRPTATASPTPRPTYTRPSPGLTYTRPTATPRPLPTRFPRPQVTPTTQPSPRPTRSLPPRLSRPSPSPTPTRTVDPPR